MPTWKLEIEYEGTRYRGWQQQHNERSVEGEIQKVLYELFSGRVQFGGAEMTEPGIHALGQIAHLRVGEIKVDVTPKMIRNGLNDLLPHDINILGVKNAPEDFDAHSDIASKQYLYRISTRRNAFQKSTLWWIKDELDPKKMAIAARTLVGKHSFESFCQQDNSSNQSLTVDVDYSEVFLDGDQICFRIRASRFLPKMIRRLVGILAEVGRGNLPDSAFVRLLKFPSTAPAKFTAPPSGLFLEKVFYDS